MKIYQLHSANFQPPTYKLMPIICPKRSVVHLKEESGMLDCSICNDIAVYPHTMEPLNFITLKTLALVCPEIGSEQKRRHFYKLLR